MDLTAPPGDTTRLFIVEKTGAIRIWKAGAILPRPFLDIATRVSRGSEQGLLGLAFHPLYAGNGRFYVDFTDPAGDTRVVEFLVSGDPDSASATERQILFVDQPYANHNGGQIAFGPDGYLYVGMGDGGSGGDPENRAQNPAELLGKLLRIDVNAPDPGAGTEYSIPSDNPFRGRQGYRPEIWALGLRNPWRFSFDRATGDLYIGDVGQDRWEEIDFEPAGAGGRNYGWNVMEGTHCYAAATCEQTGLTLPVAEYSHDDGCSITGGYVNRGQDYPALAGQYIFTDYCTGNLWAVNAADTLASGSADITRYGVAPINPTGFGEDEAGELYLVNGSGEIYRLTAG